MKLDWRSAYALFFVVCLEACGTFGVRGLHREIPLPDLSSLDCCWQGEQQVEIVNQHNRMTLHAATLFQNGELTLAALDAMGKTLLVVCYRGDNQPQDVMTPPDWEARYSRLLMVAVLLRMWMPGSWIKVDDNWRVEHDGDKRVLMYNGAVRVTITQNNQQYQVSFADTPISLRIKPLSRRLL